MASEDKALRLWVEDQLYALLGESYTGERRCLYRWSCSAAGLAPAVPPPRPRHPLPNKTTVAAQALRSAPWWTTASPSPRRPPMPPGWPPPWRPRACREGGAGRRGGFGWPRAHGAPPNCGRRAACASLESATNLCANLESVYGVPAARQRDPVGTTHPPANHGWPTAARPVGEQ